MRRRAATRRQQVANRRLAPALALLDLLRPRFQTEQVGGFAHQFVAPERFDLFGAQPRDVEGVAAHEMAETLHACASHTRPPVQRRTASPSARAARDPHTGQVSGNAKATAPSGRLPVSTDTIWGDHVAGALDDDGIALAYILAGDLVLVVKGRARDAHAAHSDGPQVGDRGQRAGAPHLDGDVLYPRDRLFRLELVRHRPARTAAHRAESRLPVQPVGLVDDSVDVEIELRAPRLDVGVIRRQRLDGFAQRHRLVELEPEPRKTRPRLR